MRSRRTLPLSSVAMVQVIVQGPPREGTKREDGDVVWLEETKVVWGEGIDSETSRGAEGRLRHGDGESRSSRRRDEAALATLNPSH